MSDRRTFLRGLVSLPLLGGGVTLIGAPSAPVPLVQAAALPTFDDPRQRARYAWEAFAAAMRDLTSDADGWCIIGAAERYHHAGSLEARSFARFAALKIDVDTSGRFGRRPFVSERHREIALDPAEEALLREREAWRVVAREQRHG